MNKSQLTKSVGFRVQLRPVPRTRNGQPMDLDWTIRTVDDLMLELDEPSSGLVAKLGLDHIYSFMSNPRRDSGSQRYGFLQLHVQLTLDGHTIHIEPLPGPRSPGSEPSIHPHSFSPLTLEHDGHTRYFSWRGRDPLHLIQHEEPPRQLFGLTAPLCTTLRRDSGFEPQFNLPNNIRGEVVYELSPDLRAKWRLVGGSADGTGDQVLVLVPLRGAGGA